MVALGNFLDLDRCPHCSVSKPRLQRVLGAHANASHLGQNHRAWAAYECGNCGGLVLAGAPRNPVNGATGDVTEIYPKREPVNDQIPERARRYLEQAIATLHAPDGAVMLAASSVDAMLKAKGLNEGTLYQRINKAATDHIITDDMAIWAHQVRLDANDPRHADEKNPHHDEAAAKRVVEFATAMAQFLFVIPSMVTRGVKAAGGKPTAEGGVVPQGNGAAK